MIEESSNLVLECMGAAVDAEANQLTIQPSRLLPLYR
jgi:hypothetical protein